jgi:hypothetical protein
MEIHPPISDRTNEQLLDIIETREEWRPDIVDLAKKELVERGIPIKTQETRRTIRTKFNERIKKTKERATYTEIEKILIVLLGPILVLLFRDIFMFHSGEGYKRKNFQGWFYLFLGICLWGLILYLYLKVEGSKNYR